MVQWLQSMFGDKWVPTLIGMPMVGVVAFLGYLAVSETVRNGHEEHRKQGKHRADAAVQEAKRRAAEK